MDSPDPDFHSPLLHSREGRPDTHADLQRLVMVNESRRNGEIATIEGLNKRLSVIRPFFKYSNLQLRCLLHGSTIDHTPV